MALVSEGIARESSSCDRQRASGSGRRRSQAAAHPPESKARAMYWQRSQRTQDTGQHASERCFPVRGLNHTTSPVLWNHLPGSDLHCLASGRTSLVDRAGARHLTNLRLGRIFLGLRVYTWMPQPESAADQPAVAVVYLPNRRTSTQWSTPAGAGAAATTPSIITGTAAATPHGVTVFERTERTDRTHRLQSKERKARRPEP